MLCQMLKSKHDSKLDIKSITTYLNPATSNRLAALASRKLRVGGLTKLRFILPKNGQLLCRSVSTILKVP